MKLAPVLTVLLFGGAIAASACVVKDVDTSEDGGGGTATSQGGDTNQGGDINQGGDPSQGGAGGAGGAGVSCEETCVANFPDGVDDWDVMVSCLFCSACYDDCDGGTGDVCTAGSEDPAMCSIDAMSVDCNGCVNSDCAQTNVCVAEVGTCGGNDACVDLNECYFACGG
jgi:hypothetical protein